MTFNSIEFVLLLVLVLSLHWTVPRRWRNPVILVASYVFYGWWDARLVSLLALSTMVDFLVARGLGRCALDAVTARRGLLGISLAVNLGVLAAFKYAGFFIDSAAAALGSLGLQANPALLQVVLPIGISFYTFQTIAYTVDTYRGRILPARNLVTFATYVAYFPQLVAGPIERAQRLLPQIQRTDRTFPTGARLQQAASLIAFGLAKKVVLADGVAPIVNDAFAAPGQQSWLTLCGALVGFAIQIYGDFAGYSNIARGVSLLFGIELMTNFREPYLSRSITEFWQRWHISLSTWLRDYLYIPLGGNRGSRLATLRNLMLTMVLGGLWHGASWTFVVWGALHGLFLILHRLVRSSTADRQVDPPLGLADMGRILGTFLLVTATWTFFRADSLGQAAQVLGRIVGLRAGATDVVDLATVGVLAAMTLALDLAQRRQSTVSDVPLIRGPIRAGVLTAALALLVLVFAGNTPEPFIYFQF
ncbi:MAG: MBOAT family O-acyltransferase [Euzebya sp.]